MDDGGIRFRNLDGSGPVDWSDIDATQRPRLRLVKPEPEPEPTESRVAAPDAAMHGLDSPDGPTLADDGERVADTTPPRSKVDPVVGLRSYLAAIRELLDREE
jgi:hypothetical protein